MNRFSPSSPSPSQALKSQPSPTSRLGKRAESLRYYSRLCLFRSACDSTPLRASQEFAFSSSCQPHQIIINNTNIPPPPLTTTIDTADRLDLPHVAIIYRLPPLSLCLSVWTLLVCPPARTPLDCTTVEYRNILRPSRGPTARYTL